MPITFLEPIPAGNAIRVYMEPPTGALNWRVLRRTADIFTGADDGGAVVIVDDCTDNVVLDLQALVNGTLYFYRMFSWDGAAWTAEPSVSVIPAASYQGDAIDPIQTIAKRLEAGLAVEVLRGELIPQSGLVPVFTAPVIIAEKITFPCVTLHMENEAPAERGIGDDPVGATFGADGWSEYQGWLARTQINIAAVARTSDERHAMRRAMDRILKANLAVFAGLGINQLEWTFADSEDLTDKAAPLFMSGGSISCTAHSFVAALVPAITATTATTDEPIWSYR